MKFLRVLLTAFAVLAAPMAVLPALAGNVALLTGPQDPSQLNATINGVIIQGNQTWGLGNLTTASGTTTSTCNALKCTVSVTGLTTAAGAVSAAMVVTDSSVTAVSQVMCQVNNYSGTGRPGATFITTAAGSFSFKIVNADASSPLNATVPVACVVYN